MEMRAVIAVNIQSAMKRANINQSGLARELHVPRQTVSRIVLGKRNVNASELKQIADLCGVSISELVKTPRRMNIQPGNTKFMGEVTSEEAQKAFQQAELLMQIYEFEFSGSRTAKLHRDSWTVK